MNPPETTDESTQSWNSVYSEYFLKTPCPLNVTLGNSSWPNTEPYEQAVPALRLREVGEVGPERRTRSTGSSSQGRTARSKGR